MEEPGLWKWTETSNHGKIKISMFYRKMCSCVSRSMYLNGLLKCRSQVYLNVNLVGICTDPELYYLPYQVDFQLFCSAGELTDSVHVAK